MDLKRIFSNGILFVLLSISCIDRLDIDNVTISSNFPLVIDGYISDADGPYTITITRSFDLEAKYNLKESYSAKKLTIFSDNGQTEDLTEVSKGVYQTNKFKGEAGRAYKLRVEFPDGRIYESVPDTLMASGKIDSVYYTYDENKDLLGTPAPQFIFKLDGTGVMDLYRYMWNLTGTFKALTHPEYDVNNNCYFFEGKCNFVPPCSGMRNISNFPPEPEFVRALPCQCCTCWYNIYNTEPILSDRNFVRSADYRNVFVGKIPINGWIFMEKVRVEMSMKTLSERTFKYFESIRDQKSAVNSLFQPITGKIPLNFEQLAGSKQEVQGIFYAAGISKRDFYIDRKQVPNNNTLPTPEDMTMQGLGWISCLDLYPNSTTIKPAFWQD